MVKEKLTDAEKRISQEGEFEMPDLEKISCRDCAFRAKDRKIGKDTVNGAQLAMCEVFPLLKPNEVLWENEDCPYYIGDDE